MSREMMWLAIAVRNHTSDDHEAEITSPSPLVRLRTVGFQTWLCLSLSKPPNILSSVASATKMKWQ
ncbi:hypothetical protein H9L39_04131 [Fusarium oxysporum f. sp. albedinis]|nr:hypothetical protein H9L39_04131 [Fusarium oxysporum f. sp. albedinis]